MKILVLENNPKELASIEQALGGKRNILIPITSSEQAAPFIQSGESHFLIANWDTSDLRTSRFMMRARAINPARPIYILLTTMKDLDDRVEPVGMDDIIQRPFKAVDLKNRVAMAERILSLANSLAVAKDQLESKAVFDDLTGFMNRKAFLHQSTGELERSRRASLPISFIALDIDNFKIINDTFGTETGDEVLQVFSQMIREKSRPYDCIGRWAGDEFVIVLAGVIGADAEKVAERIIAGIRGTRIEVPNEPPLNVKVSAGIASVARISTSTAVEELIEQSRQAMSRAKEAGGNQIFLAYI
ncbi:MAG: diguanylate cyclase [Anaerolineales bacterium]|nr:diguanylate cyclase [Anaerolineales bacterium]